MRKKRRFTLGSFSRRYGKKSMKLLTPLNRRFSFLGDIWYLKRLQAENMSYNSRDNYPYYDAGYGVIPPEQLLPRSDRKAAAKKHKKEKRGGTMVIASLFLIAAAVIMFILAERIKEDNKAFSPSDYTYSDISDIEISEDETDTEEEIIDYNSISSLDVDVSETINTVSVSAQSVCDEGSTVDKLHVDVVTTGGEDVYSGYLESDKGTWEFGKPSMSCIITVTAYASDGSTHSTEQYLYPQENVFIWPVTPKYVPLIHDYYHINTGKKYVYTYTHNNGTQREKHYVFGIRRYHYGFDITSNPNTDVLAMDDGTVVTVANHVDSTQSTGYGKYIIIKHKEKLEGKTVYALYAHLSKFKVKKGAKVKQGQVIGLSGNTGGSRIPHLHLEVRLGANNRNNCIDPLEILPSVSFDNLKTHLSADDGFMESSINLYAAMLEGGWDYSMYALAKSDITVNGIFIPKGSELEILKREGTKITCLFDGTKVNLKTSQLVYTYNYPDSEA